MSGGKRRVALGGAAAAGVAAALTQARRTANQATSRRSQGTHTATLVVGTPDGTRLHTTIDGPDGAPTIVMVHCWTGTKELWHYAVDSLAGEFRIVTYDHRGHGISGDAGRDGYSITALARDLEAVLEATVPEGEPVVLVGHSMGAMTIVKWAGMHRSEVPERVAGAVLLSTGMGDLTANHGFVGKLPGPFEGVRGMVADAVLGTPAPIKALPVPIIGGLAGFAALGPNARHDDIELTARMALDCRARARAGCGRAMAKLDIYESISALDIPAVVIAGRHDLLTPSSHTERLCTELPDCEETLVDLKAGHMTPLESHELLADAIHSVAKRAGVWSVGSPAGAAG